MRWALLLLGLGLAACDGGGGGEKAVVERIIDGDTVELQDGQRLRYLMIDTPETTGGATDCYGQEAKDFNTQLVLGQEVELTFDVERTDNFGRLLAYVSVAGREVNTLMVERGYACVLLIPPNGEDRRVEFENLEMEARGFGRGMWGACEVVTCD
ncbi:MAG TPA: thermonuclease family protein [Myxococcota bacterium]|nr:thermonuclease family protein [Myxococcota bacterium]HRY95474.1 thermonuclease family protein [Myxococcota bacterium]HSA22204.1 thermonuclease family protein [Myxococcota bacterium]